MASRQGSLKDYANMPIFMDDGNSINAPGSHALQSLQGYGSKVLAVDNFNRFTSGISALDPLSSGTSRSAVEPPVFENLNLNSVDEEDEFLYGDSSSLPEAPGISTETKVEACKPNSGWSDEEDFYIETVIPKKKVGKKKNPYVWNIHNDGANIPTKIPVGETSNIPVIRNVCLEKPLLGNKSHSPQRSVSASKGDLKLQVSIKNSDTGKSMPSAKVEAKSKYHAAAEILKKQTIEKSKGKMKEGFVTDKFIEQLDKKSSLPVSNMEQTAKRTVILPKNSKKISLDPISVNVTKSHIKGDLRRPAKHFFESDLTDVSDNFPDVVRKHSTPHADFTHDLKAYQSTKGISSFQHPSGTYEVPRKRHSRSPSPRYSERHSRSPSYVSSRYSSQRSRSPSFGSHSRKRSYSPSFDGHSRDHHNSRTRSPEYSRRRSPISKRRSPNEYSRRHYSRSPPIKSRERSPMYHKRRSRSKSPRYHSPKLKHPDADKEKSNRKTETSLKMDRDFRSGTDELSSLAFGTHSVISDKQQDRSDVLKNKNLKLLEMSEEDLSNKSKVENSQTFFEDVTISKPPDVPASSKPPVEPIVAEETDNDVFKSLNEEEKKMLTMYNQLESMDFITELLRTQQAPAKYDEPAQTSAEPFQNVEVGVNMYGVPTEQDPSVSYSQMFPFNPVPPSIPLQLPPINAYTSVTPLPLVQPPETYSYPPIMNVHQPAVAAKQTKPQKGFRRNLRSIPVSDNMSIPSTQSSNLKEIKPVVSALQQQEIELLSNYETGTRSDENTVERIPPKIKVGKEGNDIEKMPKKLTAAEVRSKENRSSMLENFKKLKAARSIAHAKVNRAVCDIIEMRNLIDQTWSKKSAGNSEKVIYGKCKSVLATSTDIMNKYIKEAKHCDEELSRFKDKMPPELQSQATRLKPEDYMKEPEALVANNYILFDAGKHSCYSCNKQLMNIAAMMDHLHSSEHQENIDSGEKGWIDDFRKKPLTENEKIKNGILHPVQGIEFMKPSTGFFCTLCKEYCFDIEDAELHLKGIDHFMKYKAYLKDNPLYDSKCLVKRLVKYSMCSKEKEKIDHSEMQKKSLKRMKNNDAADEKAKKILKKELSNVFEDDELEEEDSISIETKSTKNDSIKLTLSHDKDKSKQNEEKKSSKDSKAVQRVVYIGKAPNFKARSKPWYKRETFSESKADGNASCTDIMEKLKEKISTLPAGKSSTPQTSASKQPNSSSPLSDSKKDFGTPKNVQEVKSTESVKDDTKIKEKEKPTNENVRKTKHKDNKNEEFVGPLMQSLSNKDSSSGVDSNTKDLLKTNIESGREVKISKSNKDGNLCTKSGVPTAKENKSKINDPVKQALSNILYGTDSSSRPPVSLSEITLPKKTVPGPQSPLKISVPSKSNTETVPMEISPTKEVANRPKTEEEKDFFILGINKDDMKPLAIPVPPPMLNYYSPAPSNVAPSVPPTHIIKNVPPPGYDRSAANISYIHTNVPPPGYNVNAMNSSVCPIPSCNTTMQVAPTIFPMNIPPPGYNATSHISTHTSGTHFSPPRPSVPVLQNNPIFSAAKSKKKTTANTNLITISPTKNVCKSDSSPKTGVSKSPLKDKHKSVTSDVISSCTDLSPDSNNSTSLKEENVKNTQDDNETSDISLTEVSTVTELKTETAESVEESKDLGIIENNTCEGQTDKKSIVETNVSVKVTEDLKQSENISAPDSKMSDISDPPSTVPECKMTVNIYQDAKKVDLGLASKISVSTYIEDKLDQSTGDITINEKCVDAADICETGKNESQLQSLSDIQETEKGISDDVQISKESNISVKEPTSVSNGSSVSNLGPATDNKFAEESLVTQKASVAGEFRVHDEENIQITDDQIMNDSSDNAESVFKYQVFEKLPAVTQSSEDSASENISVKEGLESSNTDQFAPPVLILENSQNYDTSNKNNKKSDVLKFSLETYDSNQCTPPVLELEVYKSHDSQKYQEEPSDALRSSDNSEASNCLSLNVSNETDNKEKTSLEIPELSGHEGKENTAEPCLNTVVICDMGTNFHVETFREPCSDASYSMNSRKENEQMHTSKIDMTTKDEIKNISVSLKVTKHDESVNDPFSTENYFINSMDKNLNSEIKDGKEAEESTHDDNMKTEMEGNEDSKEKNQVSSVEPKTDDAYDSDTETDEYDNEDV